ncbi:hypothetical protein BO70DRAFT_257879, partial [Aspergillus heteromorphus CBS 117.55]
PRTGLLSFLPSSWVPYAELIRLDKPHGLCLVWFPHIVGLTYASVIGPAPASVNTLITNAFRLMLWSALCRSAGCVWNDYVDQEFDRKTERCRDRPIARGAVTSMQAQICAAILISLAVFSIRDMPSNTKKMAGVVIGLSLIYPYCKRFTSFPQVVLGFSLGTTVALSAYALDVDVLAGKSRISTICLMLSIMMLIIFFDVVYARQDTADDVKSGVKGMAVLFRHHLVALLGSVACGIAGLLWVVGSMVDMCPQYILYSVVGVFLGL